MVMLKLDIQVGGCSKVGALKDWMVCMGLG